MKSKGCLVKKSKNKRKIFFKNVRLWLPFIIYIRNEKKLIELLKLEDVIVPYILLWNEFSINLVTLKKIISGNKEGFNGQVLYFKIVENMKLNFDRKVRQEH